MQYNGLHERKLDEVVINRIRKRRIKKLEVGVAYEYIMLIVNLNTINITGFVNISVSCAVF